MWLSLCGLLALLVFGYKIVAAVIRVVLFALHHGGLLSNISLDAHTTLTITLKKVDICVWRNVWTFLRSPTQAMLVAVEIPSVHALVKVSNAQTPNAHPSPESRNTNIDQWHKLDTTVSLKCLDHPLWKPVRGWIHRLGFLCYFVHAVGFTVEDIGIDVVQVDGSGTTTCVRVQQGSASAKVLFDSNRGLLELHVDVARTRPTQVRCKAICGEINIGLIEARVAVPISRNMGDLRAPLPVSCSIACSSISATVDMQHILEMHMKQQQFNLDNKSHQRTTTRSNEVDDLVALISGSRRLPLRLVEALPASILLRVSNVSIHVDNGGSGDRIDANLDVVKVEVVQAGANSFGAQPFGSPTQDIVCERKVGVDLGVLVVALNGRPTAACSTVKLDHLRVDGELKLAIIPAQTIDYAPENFLWSPVVSCVARVNGESKGVLVNITDDLAPWIFALHEMAASPKSETQLSRRDFDASCEDDTVSVWDIVSVEVQIHAKILRTDVLFVSRELQCVVLPKGVPSIALSIDEVVIFAHPFINDESLGIRAKSDLQASRLKIYFLQSDRLLKTSFLSLDIVRVFIDPISIMTSNHVPAEVEMEAEWLEVRWTPEALHAIGGLLGLGVFILSPLLNEKFDWESDEYWDPQARDHVPPMKSLSQVNNDEIADCEAIKFRCSVNRSLVMFSHTRDALNHVDYVTVDTIRMSVEETTGRFRISILETKIFHAEHPTDLRSSFKPNMHAQRVNKKRSTHGRRAVPPKRKPPHLGASNDTNHNHAETPYFYVKVFALEENRIPSCPMTALDMFVDDVRCKWTMEAQERVVELIRRITFSTWEMLYRMRSSYGIHCTPKDGRYNRPGGLSAALDDMGECMRSEKLLAKLISAGGDNLNRIRASNICFTTKFGGDDQGYDFRLQVGLFGSDDLPELWIFGDVSVTCNAIELLGVHRVNVRHTVEKRRDYVFGVFEEMLRLRQAACVQPGFGLPRNDGMMIHIDGLRVAISVELNLINVAQVIQADLIPFADSLSKSLTSAWRPQHDVFFNYFLRVPNTPGQLSVWIELSNINITCSDRHLEAWLERMYPLWIEELEEQGLRSQILDEQVTTLKLTNAQMLQDDSFEDMKSLLVEKNARIYYQKVKKLQAKVQHATTAGQLLVVTVGFVSADVSFESSNHVTLHTIRRLDEASAGVERVFESLGLDASSFVPKFALLLHQRLQVAVENVCVRARNFPTPVAAIDGIKCHGEVVLCAPRSSDSSSPYQVTSALRCFMDLDIYITKPTVFFGPGYVYTLQELGTFAGLLMPWIVLDVDKAFNSAPWDIVRRIIHGNARINIADCSVRLLATSSTFSPAEYLEVALRLVVIEYCSGTLDIEIDRLTAKIEPDALSNIAEFSNISLQIHAKWSTLGVEPSIHYAFPVLFQSLTGEETLALDLQHPCIIDSATPKSIWNPVECFEATEVFVSIFGKVAPKSPSSSTNERLTKREIAARTAIVLYTKHVEWLIRFARTYQTIPTYPFPRRGKRVNHRIVHSRGDLGESSILRIFKGLTIHEFDIVGLDIALYHSEKSPVGIRACINDKIGFSASVLEAEHDIGQRVRVQSTTKSSQARHLPIQINGFTWVVHDVTLIVQDVQVRICTPQTGSRGESLISVHGVCLSVGGKSERIEAHFALPEPRQGTRSDRSVPDALKGHTTVAADTARTKTKKNILEHFAIEHHNPYCYKDSDDGEDPDSKDSSDGVKTNSNAMQLAFFEEFRRLGFILGLAATEVRVLVTVDAVETLIDLIENWIKVIRACLPELSQVPEELLRQPVSSDQEAIPTAAGIDSPKKLTSLAEDPRFGPIFHAANPAPKLRSASLPDDPPQYGGSESSLTASPNSIVEPFLIVRFMDCQVNFQDHKNKGSVLLALNCGSLRDSQSADSNHELIDLRVDGVQLFTAPLDIDVKSRVIWLRTLADGSYCASLHGLLKEVVAPIPTQVTIWVDRDVIVSNKVDLRIPSVEVNINTDSKNILQNLAAAVVGAVTTKVAEYKAPDYSKMLLGYRGSNQPSISSLQQLLLAKKQLKWQIAQVRWRQTCRWNYYTSERASLALSAIEGSRSIGLDMEASPLFRRRQVSSSSASSMISSVSLTGSTTTHLDATEDIQRLTQQYESVAEVLRALVSSELQHRQSTPNVQLDFTLQKASLKLSAVNADIVCATMGNLKFKMTMYEDQSGSFTLTIQNLSCLNLCPGTPYPDLLVPASNSKSWSGDDTFLRVDAEIAPPVGGIKIVQHFEVNVHPLQVCLTQDLILQLVAFFSVAPIPSTRQEEKKAEMRSHFLTAPQSNGSAGEGLLKKAAKVAGKAAHPLAFGIGRHRGEGDEEFAAATKLRAMQTLHDEATQWISMVAQSDKEVPVGFNMGDENSSAGAIGAQAQDRDISEMKDRARSNLLFKRIRLGTVEVVVTFKNKKSSHHGSQQPLEDMRGFEVKIHSLVYCEKTCSLIDLLLRIRRDIILDVLSQVGRNFTNVANFLRDQFDITRWAPFDALAPLKSLSTAIAGATAIATSPHSPRTASTSSLSVDLQQHSPRVSKAGGPATSPSLHSGASKVFQLELPENHPSLRKKHGSQVPNVLRSPEATAKASALDSLSAAGRDIKEEVDNATSHTTSKPKKMLSGFFSKSKKTSSAAFPTANHAVSVDDGDR